MVDASHGRDDERGAPPGLDFTKPNVARIYDVFLDGKDNFAADREFVARTLRLMPDAAQGAKTSRAFLRRVVRHLVVDAGIRQFVDIGSGLPTQGNVHQVAQEFDPSARTVYVDNDPVVGVHGRALLAGGAESAFVTADIREPSAILTDTALGRLIDFERPVGLLLIAILHHITDEEDPGRIVAVLRDALPKGSHLAISSFRMPGPEHPEVAAQTAAVQKFFNEKLGTGRWRSQEEIHSWFGDWELIEPGLVPVPEWRPDRPVPTRKDQTYYGYVGGVARKN
jgi:hypothetical protein